MMKLQVFISSILIGLLAAQSNLGNEEMPQSDVSVSGILQTIQPERSFPNLFHFNINHHSPLINGKRVLYQNAPFSMDVLNLLSNSKMNYAQHQDNLAENGLRKLKFANFNNRLQPESMDTREKNAIAAEFTSSGPAIISDFLGLPNQEEVDMMTNIYQQYSNFGGFQWTDKPQMHEQQGVDADGNQFYSKSYEQSGGSYFETGNEQNNNINSGADYLKALEHLDQQAMENGLNADVQLTDANESLDNNVVQKKDHEWSVEDTIQKLNDKFTKAFDTDLVNTHIYLQTKNKLSVENGEKLITLISEYTVPSVPLNWFEDIRLEGNEISFKLNHKHVDSNDIAKQLVNLKDKLSELSGQEIVSSGIRQNGGDSDAYRNKFHTRSKYFLITTLIICGSFFILLLALLTIFLLRRRTYLRNQLANKIASASKTFKSTGEGKQQLIDEVSTGNDSISWKSWFKNKISGKELKEPFANDMTPNTGGYQDLCRQRMQSTINKNGQITPMNSTINTTMSNVNESSRHMQTINSTPILNNSSVDGLKSTDSSRSSTSSWSDEPLNTINMDITTGHVILSYMEENLNDKDRLNKEWKELCNYEADPNKTDEALLEKNMNKNRYSNILPYDHTRVKLGENKDGDYINASMIIDNDPKNPAYITTQGPLSQTTSHFWQMVWEQQSVVIISLCRTIEYGSLKCNQYWPVNGCEVYDKFEVHLVSEHVCCEDYLVRSFYLKNLITNQTRTVTQFHFLTWPENGVPHSIKSVLEFRRKINKSHKSNSSPIIVHCNDGNGRAGTYILIDMVLNKIGRGVKEIDLAATLEFLRDQRPGIIKSKSQFEFSFAVVTEELQNMLKAIAP